MSDDDGKRMPGPSGMDPASLDQLRAAFEQAGAQGLEGVASSLAQEPKAVRDARRNAESLKSSAEMVRQLSAGMRADDSPRKTAENTARIAESSGEMAATALELLTSAQAQLTAVQSSLELSEQARVDAQGSERRAMWLGWSSFTVAVASLGAAVAALLVQI